MAKKKKENSTEPNPIEIDNTTKDENLSNFDEPSSKSSLVDEEKKKYEKVSFLRRMRTSIILIFLGILTGSGLGVWY